MEGGSTYGVSELQKCASKMSCENLSKWRWWHVTRVQRVLSSGKTHFDCYSTVKLLWTRPRLAVCVREKEQHFFFLGQREGSARRRSVWLSHEREQHSLLGAAAQSNRASSVGHLLNPARRQSCLSSSVHQPSTRPRCFVSFDQQYTLADSASRTAQYVHSPSLLAAPIQTYNRAQYAAS